MPRLSLSRPTAMHALAAPLILGALGASMLTAPVVVPTATVGSVQAAPLPLQEDSILSTMKVLHDREEEGVLQGQAHQRAVAIRESAVRAAATHLAAVREHEHLLALHEAQVLRAAHLAQAARHNAAIAAAEQHAQVLVPASTTPPIQVVTSPATVGMVGIAAAIAYCESSDNPTITNSSGHAGLYQFDAGTWGGYDGYTTADQAPPTVQTARFWQVYGQRGGEPWAASQSCWG